METIYHKILPAQVFLPYTQTETSEADRWMGRAPNKWGNCPSGNDFIDLFAGIVRVYGHRQPIYYARLMGLESRHLCSAVIAMSGLTVAEWSEYFVLMAADDLMRSGQLPMKFYKKLGFASVKDFSAYYKRHKGVRPTHWAKRRRKRP